LGATMQPHSRKRCGKDHPLRGVGRQLAVCAGGAAQLRHSAHSVPPGAVHGAGAGCAAPSHLVRFRLLLPRQRHDEDVAGEQMGEGGVTMAATAYDKIAEWYDATVREGYRGR
jgi:hypothetical protein